MEKVPFDTYKIEEFIGRGTFGDVYKAIDISKKRTVAIKVVNLEENEDDMKTVIQEIHFLSALRSPSITSYFETIINGMSMWIVMEYCGGGSCAELIKCYKMLDEDIVSFIIRDVLKGLEYLHAEKKVHRDIKCANILLTEDGKVKLADFGVSGQISMTLMKRNTFVGTPFWMAPEVISRRGGYNEKADIWSLGITVIELVRGSPPLSEHDPMKVLFQIPKNPAPVLEGSTYSENIKQFVGTCLNKVPVERPSASELLQHRFIKGLRRSPNIGELIKKKNVWLSQHNSKRKPRIPLENCQKTIAHSNQLIEWDFNTTTEFEFCYGDDDIQWMESNYGSNIKTGLDLCPALPARHYEGSGDIMKEYPSLSLLDNLGGKISNSGSTETNNTSPEIPSAECLENRGHKKILEKIDRLDDKRANKAQLSYLNDVMIYCLGRLSKRAKTSETKNAVFKLQEIITEFERQQPGLCEAITEEIWSHITHLKEYYGSGL